MEGSPKSLTFDITISFSPRPSDRPRLLALYCPAHPIPRLDLARAEIGIGQLWLDSHA
jgi:hypothetical protein